MKRLLLLLSALLPALGWALVTPTFDGSTYYLVKFNNSGLCLTALGTDANLQTQAGEPATATDKQLWRFEGTQSNFQLINKAGQYAAYSTSAARIQASANADASGWALVSGGSYYELKWLGATDTKAYMNQWGGTGAGTALGLWNTGDANNKFSLIDPSDLATAYADFNVQGAAQFTPAHAMTLWYDRPATVTGVANPWMEYSLPIGNGQLGASLFGGIRTDEIQFNEKTLWTGGPNDIGSYGQYKNFGSVLVSDQSGTIGYTEADGARDYYRYLDTQTGLAGVHYTNAAGTTTYERTYLASRPDNVIAVRYRATGADRLNLLFAVKPGDDINNTAVTYSIGQTGAAYAAFMGTLTTVTYAMRFRVVPTDGTIEKTAEGLLVKGSTEVILYLAAATDFDPDADTRKTGETSSEVRSRVLATTTAAFDRGFDAIEQSHVEDFTSLTQRVDLQIDGAASTLTTNALIDRYNTLTDYNKPEARFLEQLYFNYGRYLEISSSRGIDVPNNLQGIWNNLSRAPWNSDIHTNINIQMNYWPSEPTNLSECHLPFLNFIIRNAASANYQAAAKRSGVNCGWTVFTESNIFGGMSTWGSNYCVANAWYCSHLWQHFRYTRDETFLARAFPALWSCVQYWMARMIDDRGYNSQTQNSGYGGTPYSAQPDGSFVAPNEFSAEQNHASEDGTAHAQQLIYALLQSTREAYDILDPAVTGLSDKDLAKLDLYLQKTDQGLHTEVYTASSNLNGGWTNPRNGVAKGDTILREWKYSPYDVSNDPSHRHMSHLMALYPLTAIGPNSAYFEPAKRSLMLRGDVATGWSMGWKVNLWARAQDGDHAHTILKNALKHSTAYNTNQYAGGVYYNLYDAHSPFQIDGNFGCCAGIAEMLLQSQTDTIQFLPALPSCWPSGHIYGMRAVGGFEVDQTWEGGRLTVATIKSLKGRACPVRYAGIADRKVTNAAGEEVAYTVVAPDVILLATEEGETYTINMAEASAIKSVQKEARRLGFTVKRTAKRITVTGRDEERVYDNAGRLMSSSAK